MIPAEQKSGLGLAVLIVLVACVVAAAGGMGWFWGRNTEPSVPPMLGAPCLLKAGELGVVRTPEGDLLACAKGEWHVFALASKAYLDAKRAVLDVPKAVVEEKPKKK